MASHGSAVLVTRRPTWLALMQKRALQIQSINDYFNLTALGSRKGCFLKRSIWQSAVVQTHKSGTLSDFTKLNLTSVSHCCLDDQVLVHCSTYNLQFEVAGILCDVLLDSSPSSLALLPPQKSRLVSSKEPTGLLEQQPRNHGTAPHRDLQTQPVRTNRPPH